ncbi:hypothetical protein WJX81_003371 [Elliptochloris bilobata]|uniref:holo-[acyl-carrier-protein] synthase n=1 Tax=Elliptochloris bilobata TaxID=381761 RepID=A0AAW1SLJ3_9CHLO
MQATPVTPVRQSSRSNLCGCFSQSVWDPVTNGEEWLFLLDLLPEEDQKQVELFRFKDDQKRALLSRLLQRRCVNVALGVPWNKVRIKRTKAKKPFVVGAPARPHAPNFNFNVSHEGNYVVLASEPVCIVGVDVAAPQQIRAARPAAGGVKPASSMEDLQQTFQRQFTAHEWEVINGAGHTTEEKEDEFRRHWSLKEALVKARGDGLGFALGKADFRFDDQDRNSARVLMEGRPQQRWRFTLQELGNGHWVSVARGPPEDIVDAWQEFSATLLYPCTAEPEFQAALDAPSPPFSVLRVIDLLPEGLRAAYLDTGADAL